MSTSPCAKHLPLSSMSFLRSARALVRTYFKYLELSEQYLSTTYRQQTLDVTPQLLPKVHRASHHGLPLSALEASALQLTYSCKIRSPSNSRVHLMRRNSLISSSRESSLITTIRLRMFVFLRWINFRINQQHGFLASYSNCQLEKHHCCRSLLV